MILFIAGGWFPMLAFPLIGRIVQNGPEPPRARRPARPCEPLTARTVLRGSRKRKSRSWTPGRFSETRASETDALVSTMVLSETRGLLAFFGCPRGHRVNEETPCF